jgi:hypothetical protein
LNEASPAGADTADWQGIRSAKERRAKREVERAMRVAGVKR